MRTDFLRQSLEAIALLQSEAKEGEVPAQECDLIVEQSDEEVQQENEDCYNMI